MERRFLFGVLTVLFILLLPGLAAAQSQITGQVKDESGGILPGVTVEASSPALIEKSKTAVTDDQGRYLVFDLRPGTYKVTFTLTGFSTVVRYALELPSNFTATVNAEMKVGALEETITVSGATPMVDVQQASRTQVLTRDIIDTLPSTRNIMSVGALVAGVRMGTPDIGGSRSMEQPAQRVHGLNQREVVQLMDGMSISSNEDCLCQSYQDDATQVELSVTTSALPAETSAGGMRINTIPKDGGNMTSGTIFLGGVNGPWQANNVNDYLRQRGIQKANGIAHIENFNGSLGGPLEKDKLWFFMTARHISTDEVVANVPTFLTAPNGDFIHGIVDQYIRDTGLRLTWQASQKNKLAGFYQRVWKRKGKDFSFGQDPRGSVNRDPYHAHYGVGNAKWTSTVTSKLLVEAGYSTSYQHWSGLNEAGRFSADRTKPLWYSLAQTTDTALNINYNCAYSFGCTQWQSVAQTRTEATREFWNAAVSYVTGSHNFKVGFQDSRGPDDAITLRNGDLIANYTSNKPTSVTVHNTPVISKTYVNHDLGIFVQDSWTISRLTLNPGVRVESFNASAPATTMGVGRFAPARYFPDQQNLPNWPHDLAPRMSVAYDLFGNGKTALKATASKYYAQFSGSWTKRYANSALVSESRNWFDCPINAAGTACSGVVLPTNGDGIVQDNEIGPSSSSTFGLRSDRNPDPNIKRASNMEYSAAIQHQLTSRVSVQWAWFHRTWHDLELLDRTLISASDYTSFQAAGPSIAADPDLVAASVIDPSAILTIYNLNSAKRAVFGAAQVDETSSDISIYNGFETSFNARLVRGSTVFGSWTADHNISVFCSATKNDPNGTTTTDLYLGETVASGGPFCDQRQFGIPYRHEFKLAGNYPLGLGFDVGAVLQSYGGLARVITWQPA